MHADFYPLMAFLRISPVSYALTTSPTIYAEIVQEMCGPSGEINFTIKGNSCVLTPSVINEALHFPNSNFETIPNGGEIISMLKAINYAADPLGRINRKHFRKEWAYFFVTLSKVFTGKYASFDSIILFALRIAYSLLYGKRIDIGRLLLDEFAYKFDQVQNRDQVICYARFLMIIANYFCKDLSISDRNDILPVPVQQKKLFATLVTKNPNAEVEFVLPEHVRVQVSKKPRHMTFSCLNLQRNRMIDNSSRVEALTAETDQCKEAHHSAAEAELRKLEPEEEPHSD